MTSAGKQAGKQATEPSAEPGATSTAAGWLLRGVLVLVDLGARAAVPASVLLITSGYGDGAVATAAAMNALAVLRGVLTGWSLRREVLRVYHRIVNATGRCDVAALRARPDDQQVALLIEAADRTAQAAGVGIPRLLADGLALVLIAAAVVWRLGTGWLLLGALLAATGALVLLVVQRLLSRAEQRLWAHYGDLVRDVEVLLDAATELRAHGRQDSFSHELLTRVAQLAKQQQRTTTVSALIGLLPLGVALLATVAPLRAELLALFQHDTPRQIAEIGVLGATGLVVGFGFARAAEALLRSAPRRRSLEAFLSQAPAPQRRQDCAPLPSLADADIVLDGVSIVYPGSSAQTPSAISHRWRPGTGLALLGDNGAGKTSLMLALLGLLEPSAGEIRIGDVCLSDVDPEALHKHIVYLPQHPFAALGASVGWHLSLWAKPGADRRHLEAALRAVDLFEALAQHRKGGAGSVLDVPLGRLSGGERRRLQLARVFLHGSGNGGGAASPPLLIVLDEPEAGLDRSGRRRLGTLIQQLTASGRVLLSAHDPAVIPEDFVTLTCVRRPLEASSASPAERPQPRAARGARSG